MDLRNILQLPRQDMKKKAKQAGKDVKVFDAAGQKIVKSNKHNISFHYPDAKLLKYLNNHIRSYHGNELLPETLPDTTVFFLWLCFGSLTEVDLRFNYTQHRKERMMVVASVIIRASFLKRTVSLDRVCEYYHLLLIEANRRGFYIPID